ncbi:hypothetical protein HDE_02100 [Halotydeus destructor]|nr:hypothetical protein HDE_02100 [Halotydeus destructor]
MDIIFKCRLSQAVSVELVNMEAVNLSSDQPEKNLRSEDAEAMDTNSPAINGNASLENGSIVFPGEESEDDDVFMEAVDRILELERRKKQVDVEEQNLRAELKERHEREKEAMKESSELLGFKEKLRDDLISMKEKRERLIDEYEVLGQVDTEMKNVANLTHNFNDTLEKHIKYLDDKQAKIYTLKPTIQGNSVEIDCDIYHTNRDEVDKIILDAVQLNMNNVKEELEKNCDEYFIKRQSELTEMRREEQALEKELKQHKANLRILEKPAKQSTTSGTVKAGPASWKKGSAYEETTSYKKASKTPDDDEVSVASSRRSAVGRPKKTKEFTCEACSTSFVDHDKYTYHVFRECSYYDEMLERNGLSILDKTVECHQCKEKMSSYADMVDHVKQGHGQRKRK